MITVHTITYNEEIIIEFFINHYRKLFDQCHIILYDNESTDNTTKIAKKHDCEIITYSTNNTLQDSKYLEIKNNCWKNSKTNWNIVCDCDELIFISEQNLQEEEKLGTNIIYSEGYTMMNNNEVINLPLMKYGYRDVLYDKNILFNKKDILEINYQPGCHTCSPIPYPNKKIQLSEKKYRILHYQGLSPTYLINRRKSFASRLSKTNIEKGWGIHYMQTEKQIRDHFDTVPLINVFDTNTILK